jgi:hypothetical protein
MYTIFSGDWLLQTDFSMPWNKFQGYNIGRAYGTVSSTYEPCCPLETQLLRKSRL